MVRSLPRLVPDRCATRQRAAPVSLHIANILFRIAPAPTTRRIVIRQPAPPLETRQPGQSPTGPHSAPRPLCCSPRQDYPCSFASCCRFTSPDRRRAGCGYSRPPHGSDCGDWKELDAHGGIDCRDLPRGAEFACLLVDTEMDDGVAILIRGKEKCSGWVDIEVARCPALRGTRIPGTRAAPSVGRWQSGRCCHGRDWTHRRIVHPA